MAWKWSAIAVLWVTKRGLDRRDMAKAIMERPLVCFFCAVTYPDSLERDRALTRLTQEWGPVAKESPQLEFSAQTAYYDSEMGPALKKQIFVFEKLLSLEGLYETKIVTNGWEAEGAIEGKRRFNLDPGYLDEAKLVLFSAKDFYHRLYQGQGIYAELTLFYRAKKGYQELEWSFPDYSLPLWKDFFKEVRGWYRRKIGKS